MKLVKTLGYFIISLCLEVAYCQATLLTPPSFISEESTDAIVSKIPMSMTWESTNEATGASWKISFNHQNLSTFLELHLIKALPDGLTLDERKKFVKSTVNQQEVWIYKYGESLENPKPTPLSFSEDTFEMMTTVLVYNSGTTQSITTQQLTHLIQDKKIVFYTGAGISAKVVPTMSTIMEQLGMSPDLKKEKAALAFIKKVLAQPQSFIAPMDNFYYACFYGEPSPAHKALKKLILIENCGLLTENLDLLHQRSGINPLSRHTPGWLKSNVFEEDLKKIDVIITIGLHTDESGFLGWYREHNPEGRIIALNLVAPNYIGNEDYILLGDVQYTVPDLLEKISQQSL